MKLNLLQKLAAVFVLAWVLGDVTQIPHHDRIIWSFVAVVITAWDHGVHKLVWEKIKRGK